jgi:hypothetical protein
MSREAIPKSDAENWGRNAMGGISIYLSPRGGKEGDKYISDFKFLSLGFLKTGQVDACQSQSPPRARSCRMSLGTRSPSMTNVLIKPGPRRSPQMENRGSSSDPQ